jgi:hypothetical protein
VFEKQVQQSHVLATIRELFLLHVYMLVSSSNMFLLPGNLVHVLQNPLTTLKVFTSILKEPHGLLIIYTKFTTARCIRFIYNPPHF